jgi:hypothetical protein
VTHPTPQPVTTHTSGQSVTDVSRQPSCHFKSRSVQSELDMSTLQTRARLCLEISEAIIRWSGAVLQTNGSLVTLYLHVQCTPGSAAPTMKAQDLVFRWNPRTVDRYVLVELCDLNFSFCRICAHRTMRSAGQANEYRTKLNWAEEGEVQAGGHTRVESTVVTEAAVTAKW